MYHMYLEFSLIICWDGQRIDNLSLYLNIDSFSICLTLSSVKQNTSIYKLILNSNDDGSYSKKFDISTPLIILEKNLFRTSPVSNSILTIY